MRYRVVHQIPGGFEYMYYEYMMQVLQLIASYYPDFASYRVEIRGVDGKYHSLSAWSPKWEVKQ